MRRNSSSTSQMGKDSLAVQWRRGGARGGSRWGSKGVEGGGLRRPLLERQALEREARVHVTSSCLLPEQVKHVQCTGGRTLHSGRTGATCYSTQEDGTRIPYTAQLRHGVHAHMAVRGTIRAGGRYATPVRPS